jgi:uncharacterized protein Veg
MAANTILAGIRKDLDSFIGEKIKIKANKGRKRTIEREGILEKTYPNIFVVMINECSDTKRRVSYSYTDLLTETVELVVCRDNAETRIEYSPK